MRKLMVTSSCFRQIWRAQRQMRPVSWGGLRKKPQGDAGELDGFHATVINLLRGTRKSRRLDGSRRSRPLTVLDLIDGRIAELDRLATAAALDQGGPRGDGPGLDLLLVTLRALRQHKVAGAGVPLRALPTQSPCPARGLKRLRCLYFFWVLRGGEGASKPGVAPAISALTSIPGATTS